MRPKKSISYQELRDLIPEQYLDDLAIKTKVDHSVSKLTGKNMFSLLLYGLTSEKTVSLRILEDVFTSPVLWAQHQQSAVRYSAISQRLAKMNPSYFREIFEHLNQEPKIEQWLDRKARRYLVKKFDSTIVTLSSKLLRHGLRVNPGKKDLKFSLGLTDGLPASLELLIKQTFASEDKALPKVMARNQSQAKKQDQINILLFDRGVHKKDTYDWITNELASFFITRLSTQGFKVDEVQSQVKGRTAGELILESDEVIHFETAKETREQKYRLVTARDPKTNQSYQFLTNIFFLNAVEISQLYKSRWEIETFFKFIKQHLSFSHLISRSINGIKIQMYMTMIAAILIAIYKKINKVEGWLIAKMRFTRELELHVIETFFEVLAPLYGYSKNISVPDNTS